MFNQLRKLLDRYECANSAQNIQTEGDWLVNESNFDFAKVLYNEVPDIITIAKMILIQAESDCMIDEQIELMNNKY